jgi:wyosine [tRNA(Phe)-imidazoG37] synthetase (radical SAM superfamily)
MLHQELFYGPVLSRRLGSSLGVNLLPVVCKVCNFDCIYCECGVNRSGGTPPQLPQLADIRVAFTQVLEEKKQHGIHLDHITFSGNGEPTLHPQFAEIVALTREMRDRYYPQTLIAVLTDSANLHRQNIREALWLADKAICKLDAGSDVLFRAIARPAAGITIEHITQNLVAMQGRAYVQTMLLRGRIGDVVVDNTRDEEVQMWLRRLRAIRPRGVLLYTLDRVPPYATLCKVEAVVAEKIAAQVRALGFTASYYG